MVVLLVWVHCCGELDFWGDNEASQMAGGRHSSRCVVCARAVFPPVAAPSRRIIGKIEPYRSDEPKFGGANLVAAFVGTGVTPETAGRSGEDTVPQERIRD